MNFGDTVDKVVTPLEVIACDHTAPIMWWASRDPQSPILSWMNLPANGTVMLSFRRVIVACPRCQDIILAATRKSLPERDH